MHIGGPGSGPRTAVTGRLNISCVSQRLAPEFHPTSFIIQKLLVVLQSEIHATTKDLPEILSEVAIEVVGC